MNYSTLDLQSDSLITSNIQYKQMAERRISTYEVSRRAGNKYVTSEFGTKRIVLEGHVISQSTSGLLGLIDNIQQILATPEQELVIDSGRTYTATCVNAEFPELYYNKSVTPFRFEFLSSSPFSLGQTINLPFTVPSGVVDYTFSTTISGTAFSEPVLTLTFSGISDSGITALELSHITQGSDITVSGLYTRGNEIVFDYQNATATYSGLLTDYLGTFTKWNVGTNSLSISLTGTNNFGLVGLFSYIPRYYL